MDAISFVLGVKSAHLRSNSLRELIYRPGVASHECSTVSTEIASVEAPNSASVSIAFTVDDNGQELCFKRS